MGSFELMEWFFYSYVIIAVITYSFFAFIYLFEPGKGALDSICYTFLTMGCALTWPIFYMYLAVCFYFKLPNIYIEALNNF